MNPVYGFQKKVSNFISWISFMKGAYAMQTLQFMLGVIVLSTFVLGAKAERPSKDYNQPMLEYFRQEELSQMKKKADSLRTNTNKRLNSLAHDIDSKVDQFEKIIQNLSDNEIDIMQNIAEITAGVSYRLFFDVIKLPNGKYSISKLDPYGFRLVLSSKKEKADVIIPEIKKLKNLRLISFCNCYLSSYSISQLTTMNKLNSITFNYNVTDEDVSLCLSQLPALKHIRFIKCNKLKNSFLAKLDEISSVEEMEWVDTYFNMDDLRYLLRIERLKYVFINGKEILFNGTLDELNVAGLKSHP